jgi:hypothetical protein
VSNSDGSGTLSLSLRDPWLSDKALTRSVLKFLVPIALLTTLVEYILYSSLGVLISIILFTLIASALLAGLKFGKEKWIVTIPTVRRHDKREYGEIYWKLVEIVECILNERGLSYERIYEWPRTSYEIIDKGFSIFIPASIDRHETVYRFQLVISPVTSSNYIHAGDVKRRLSEALARDGLV